MHKALYPIVKKLSKTVSVHGTSVQSRELEEKIRLIIKKQGLRREVSFTDIMQASKIVMKKCQEAECNMVQIRTLKNHYDGYKVVVPYLPQRKIR